MTEQSKNLEWELLGTKDGPSFRIFKARYDIIRNPRNGTELDAVVLESNDAVNVVAITTEQKVLCIRQYRFGIRKNTVEVPGGFVDKGEHHKEGAIRELREETGYTASNWQYLGFVYGNPAFMDNKIHHWLATDAKKTAALELDDGEAIEILELSFEELKTYAKEGAISHPHALSALVRVFNLWDAEM